VHRPDVDGNQPALELHNSISFLDGLPLSVNHRRTRQKISLIGLVECHQGPWYHPGQLPSYLQAVMSPRLHASHAPEICLFLTPVCLCSGISMDSGKVWNVRIVAGNGDLTIVLRRFTSQKEAVGRRPNASSGLVYHQHTRNDARVYGHSNPLSCHLPTFISDNPDASLPPPWRRYG